MGIWACSERDPRHFIQGELVTSAIIEPGGAGGFMASHVLCDLQLATVPQIGGDAGGPEAMDADLRSQPGRLSPALKHQVLVGLGQGNAVGHPPMARGTCDKLARPFDDSPRLYQGVFAPNLSVGLLPLASGILGRLSAN